MQNFNDLFGDGGRPLRIVTLTSGTGTFVPLENNSRCVIRLQGGAGGGASGSVGDATFPSSGHGAAGGSGAQNDRFMRVPIAGVNWQIGAGGVGGAQTAAPVGVYKPGNNGSAGGRTLFGPFVANGGLGGSGHNPTSNTPGVGGAAGAIPSGSVCTLAGIAGGAGGGANTVGQGVGAESGLGGAVSGFGGGGGSSQYGSGGAGCTAASSSAGSPGAGYGAGGGGGSAGIAGNPGTAGFAGGAGIGGVIEIYEYGA